MSSPTHRDPPARESPIGTLLYLTGDLSDEVLEPWRPEPSEDAEVGPSPRRGRVLVAEDDPMVAALVERLLAEYGYEVVTARHGEEAMRIAHRSPVDLLVTDVRMPVMDGWELSRRLRERWPNLPVLFISGYDLELAHGAKPRGSGAFLRKPFDPDELLRQVGRLLGS